MKPLRRLAVALATSAILFLPQAAPGAETDSATASTPCVDVQIGKDKAAALDCLNDELRRSATQAHEAPQPAAPIGANSPSNETGTANDAAAREKMGNAFGRSAQPQRPPPVVPTSPLIPSAH